MQNIVLIVCDTLSAFNLPLYGYDRDTAPFLTELAEDNLFVPFAYATSPWTPPSHASIFSGDLPYDHGTTKERLHFDADSFVEELSGDGYTTYGFCNNTLLPAMGFRTGFDHFTGGKCIPLRYRGLDAFATVLDREQRGRYDGKTEKYVDFLKEVVRQRDLASLREALAYVYHEKISSAETEYQFVDDSGAAATNELIDEELESEDDPFFLFVNYMEPHETYNPPRGAGEEWIQDRDRVDEWYRPRANLGKPEHIGIDVPDDIQEDIRGLYDAEIRYLDRQLRELYETVQDRFGDTVFIITSDHGENLGHDGRWGHQYGIWERLIRVPLIIAGDPVDTAEIQETVSLRDLHDFVLAGCDPDELGSDRVFAEYYGKQVFLSQNQDRLDEFDQEKQDLVRNRSKCLVADGTGVIRHSHLPDTAFRHQRDGPGDSGDVDPSRLQVIDRRFGLEIEDVDI